MKRLGFLLLFWIGILSPNSYSQERNYAQELGDLIMQKRVFEAYDFHQQNKDSIVGEAIDLFYKYNMCNYLNQPDSAIIYLEEYLEKYPFLVDSTKQFFIYQSTMLLNFYTDKQEYQKAIELCDKLELFIQSDSPYPTQELKAEELNFLANLKQDFTHKRDCKAKREIVFPSTMETAILEYKDSL